MYSSVVLACFMHLVVFLGLIRNRDGIDERTEVPALITVAGRLLGLLWKTRFLHRLPLGHPVKALLFTRLREVVGAIASAVNFATTPM